MTISLKQAASGLGLLGLFTALLAWQPLPPREAHAAPAVASPLDRVSPDSAVLIHGRAAVLWDHPLVKELRKQFVKPLEEALKNVEKETGLTPDQLDTVTFSFPKMPQGPGDETLFVVQVVTKQPYDKVKLLAGLRTAKGEMKDDTIPLAGKFKLHFTSPTQFTVLHESLAADFVKGAGMAKDGALAGVIKAAKDPANTLTFGIDPSGLPNEIFTAAPPELQPFLPLFKSKVIMLTANTDKDLALKARFTAENAEKAQEAERSINLLKKLADDTLANMFEDKNPPPDAETIFPALREVHKAIKAAEVTRAGAETSVALAVPAKADMLKPIISGVLGVRTAAARVRSSNNMKQLALAVHNYHDTYAVGPAAAICDKKGKPLLSWRVSMLPYIEQDNLYKQFKLDEPWDSENNIKLVDKMPPLFLLPYEEGKESTESKKKGETHYVAFVGNGAMFDVVKGFKLAQIPDGTSNTLMFVEAAKGVPWSKPEDIEYDPTKPVAPLLYFEKDMCNVAFGDGSVRALSKKNEDKVWHWLVQTADGNPIPPLK